MSNPIQIKLGSTKTNSFYKLDTERDFTMIQEGKMTYNTLSILSSTEMIKAFGLLLPDLSDRLLEEQPGLAVNEETGVSTSLKLLIKDLEKGKLISVDYRGSGLSPKIKITQLGCCFLKHNVIPKDKE